MCFDKCATLIKLISSPLTPMLSSGLLASVLPSVTHLWLSRGAPCTPSSIVKSYGEGDHSDQQKQKNIFTYTSKLALTPSKTGNTSNSKIKRGQLISLRNNFQECVSTNMLHCNFSFQKQFLESIRPMCFSVKCVFYDFLQRGKEKTDVIAAQKS